MGFAVVSLSGIIYQPIMYSLIGTGTELTNLAFHAGCGAIFLAAALIGRAMLKKTNPQNFA